MSENTLEPGGVHTCKVFGSSSRAAHCNAGCELGLPSYACLQTGDAESATHHEQCCHFKAQASKVNVSELRSLKFGASKHRNEAVC